MLQSYLFWICVLAGLSSYLLLSVHRRHRTEALQYHPRDQNWPRRGFEVSLISPQVQRLRQDYLGEIRRRACHAAYHRTLLAASRRALEDFDYFAKPVRKDATSAVHEPAPTGQPPAGWPRH